MNTESLITDLAFILLLGAVVTVLFKWIKQPVVLGYIVAGFLASPHFEYLPSVTSEENIDFWAEIGIVVLLFSLGLEFSFKKLLNSGGSAVVTALVVVTGMMGAGFAIGHILQFNTINSLFLGGMLSMSSTTIIIKAFNDLGLRQKKFASLVLAVLIVEDLFAVVMMVLLSSIAINSSVEGAELLYSIAKLVFFLLIWFAVGVYVLPSLLNSIRGFLNPETLLVVSMGLCLGMAVFSVYCGFSMALGAFVMGSILAGTSYAERIEHVVTPVKDLFGAVFFISVGMMVRPDIIAEYWLPILILSAVVIVGMIVFGTAGMLLTGQTLKVAIESGFSLTQIGEFAFIIASLGMSLSVLEPTLYPIVVAVSVITTFGTPFFIKASVPFYDFVERHLPERLHFLIDRYHKDVEKNEAAGASWKPVLKRYLWRTALYSVVLLGIAILGYRYLMPYLSGLMGHGAKLLTVVVTLAAMSPFLMALMMPLSASSDESGEEEARAAINALPRTVLTIFRFLIALFFVIGVISEAFSKRMGVLVAAVLVVLLVFFFSTRLRRRMRRIESRFIDNLNERELRRSGKKNAVIGDLHLAYMTVGTACDFAGERLVNSNIRHLYGVNIVSIQRGQTVIQIPGSQERLFPGDTVGVIGTEEQIAAILPDVEKNLDDAALPSGDLSKPRLTGILLSDSSPLAGHTPRDSALRDRYDALVVAVDRGDEHIDTRPDLVFRPGDLVWLVGDPQKLASLK